MTSDRLPAGTLRVLLVEDSADDAELLLAELAASGFAVDSLRTASAEDTALALKTGTWDVVLSDYNLPGFSAEEALTLMQAAAPNTPFIIVSGCVGDEAAVAMMKAGAVDFVIKDALARLGPAVARALDDAETRRRYRKAQDELRRNEAQLRALAANMPGMVFQLQLAEGRSPAHRLAPEDLRYTYVSEGALALLGLHPGELLADAARWPALMRAEDVRAWLNALEASAKDLGTLDWEGRAQIATSDTVKWIAVKAGARMSDAGVILWDGIAMDITSAKVAERRIRESEEDFRRLSAHVETVKEKERARIAREIHDDLGGTLIGIKMGLSSLAGRLADDGALRQKAVTVDRLVDHAIESSVRIARDLRPGALDCGIVAAIQWQARDFGNRTGIHCTVRAEDDDIVLDGALSIALFRVFQEALTNVAKHAAASRVDIALALDGDRLVLEVRDNGRGIAAADRHKKASFGIRGMLERVRDLCGEIEILAGENGGTLVQVSMPYAVPGVADAALEHQYRLL